MDRCDFNLAQGCPDNCADLNKGILFLSLYMCILYASEWWQGPFTLYSMVHTGCVVHSLASSTLASYIIVFLISYFFSEYIEHAGHEVWFFAVI